MYVNFNILNQLGSPSLNSNTFANRPAAGQTGRLFISTDTFEIYRDNGTGWDLIGTGTGGGITGSGTANQVTYWTGTSAVGGESAFTYNPTTNALRVDGTMSMSIDSSWGSGTSALQMQYGSVSGASGSVALSYNTAYYNSDFRFVKNDVALLYTQSSTGHLWSSSAAGTAGNQYSGILGMLLDTNSNLGINAAPSTWNSNVKALQLPYGAAFYSYTNSASAGIFSNAFINSSGFVNYSNTDTAAWYSIQNNSHTFFTASSGTAGTIPSWTQSIKIWSTGNVTIGSTVSDGGAKLEVIGGTTILRGGTTTIRGSGATSATSALNIQDSTVTNLIRVRNDGLSTYGSGANVAFGPMNTTSLAIDKTGSGILFQMDLANGTGSLFVINGNTAAFGSGNLTVFNVIKSFAPTSGTATYINTLLNPTINQTGGASGITRGLYVNPTLTAAADWRSIEMSNNSGWGIYQSGSSANNYFNGDVLVGTTTDSGFKLDVSGSTRLNGTVRVDGQTAATAGGASGQHLIINCDGTTYKIALLNN